MIDDLKSPQVCILRCHGGRDKVRPLYNYFGPPDCRMNAIVHRGNRECIYGCLAGGHCAGICPAQAISIGEDGLPKIDAQKCTGCGTCIKECPRGVLELLPRSQLIYVACKSADAGEFVKKVCPVGCDSCAQCVRVCPVQEAIHMDGNLPLIDYAQCTSCGICNRKCPSNSFTDRARARPYAIISSQCNGCAACARVCQFGAIEGKKDARHIVNKERCTGCGQCFLVCPTRVITMMGALGYAGTNG